MAPNVFAEVGKLVWSGEEHFNIDPIGYIFETMGELVNVGYNYRSSCVLSLVFVSRAPLFSFASRRL